MRASTAVSSVAILLCVLGAAQAESFLSPDGKVRTFVVRHAPAKIDPAKATPMRLPTISRRLPSQVDMTIAAAKVWNPAPKEVVDEGSGSLPPDDAEVPAYPAVPESTTRPQAQAVGDGGQPYTTARVWPSARYFVFRRTGTLLFSDGTTTHQCSAFLVKPGVLATAAHCIVPFGSGTFYQGWQYIPAYRRGVVQSYSMPFGVWDAANAQVLEAWVDGTDPCSTPATVCQDDIGLLTLVPQSGAYLGAQTGWYGFAINGYSYSQGQAEIAQLGYSSSLDFAAIMQRTDSLGSVSAAMSQNTIIGTAQSDGSDGGPWLVNLGAGPELSDGVDHGTAPRHNIVVGVTSWSTPASSAAKQAGASPFLSSNISLLVNRACSMTPAAC